jgi:cytoskeleton protein RodZ
LIGAPSMNKLASLSAGTLLREARQSKNLSLAELAQAIKMPVQKLQLLEADQTDQLPGDAFVRALAQTVCRFLQIDAAGVMAVLPSSPAHGLDRMSHGLNQPFHDDHARSKNPIVLLAVALAVAALVMYTLPKHWVTSYWPLQKNEPAPSGGVVTQIIIPATAASQDDVGTSLGTGTTVTPVLTTPTGEFAASAVAP